MSTPNLMTDPVQIAQDTWWVGKRPPGQIFYANPYLRSFRGKPSGDSSAPFHLLIDPGSAADFGTVRAKTERVIGSVERVGGVFINHQDPDVGSAVGLMMGRFTPNAHVFCSEDTWRLVQYYNIPRDRFVPMERYPKGMHFASGERIVPVPSPFCHFVGAVMLYDPQTRVLFSGDLFGALTAKDAEGIWADESDWAGMRAFHQIYMPSNQALRHAVRKIREHCPDLEIIAPQHGRVIRGPWVNTFLERIESLPVGLDILDERQASPDELRAWSTVLARMLDLALPALPGAREILLNDAELQGQLEVDGAGLKVASLGKLTVERAVRILIDHLPSGLHDPLRYEAITAAGDLELPTPSIELEEGDAPTKEGSTGDGPPRRTTGTFRFTRLDGSNS